MFIGSDRALSPRPSGLSRLASSPRMLVTLYADGRNWLRRRRTALLLLACVWMAAAGALGIGTIVVERPRPEVSAITASPTPPEYKGRDVDALGRGDGDPRAGWARVRAIPILRAASFRDHRSSVSAGGRPALPHHASGYRMVGRRCDLD